MVAIWGTYPGFLEIYQKLDPEERRDICFVVSGKGQLEKYKDRFPVIDLEQFSGEQVERLIIPLFDMYIVNDIVWKVFRHTDLKADQIWIMGPTELLRELKKYGSMKEILGCGKLPCLSGLEYDVVFHCNLNCKGCSHFSPIAEPGFGDPVAFRKDLSRVHELVDELGEIRLVGGEPLLCDNLTEYIVAAHAIFPDTKILIFTNGIRLGSINDDLKDCMKQYGAQFSVTIYPPVENYVRGMIEQLEAEGIAIYRSLPMPFFGAWIIPAGDSDPEAAAASCYIPFCYAMWQGRIYRCSTENKIRVFEKFYKPATAFPEGGIDLYDPSLTGSKLASYLLSPIEMCRFCGKTRKFTWDRAGKEPSAEDWYGDGRI
ncbi:4Fe-4S cluster-binding domain-containing protein [Oribacterium sp. NK2B42]|uniref:4Fe-4S cluster-binding domain-containing protein n=1 Tax=Oribacterium sp. NK2B42 TaxID=689781 RepID=UPI0004149059|nr:4Fe-4S cluster-binding domain-containing protein [Oribacterium sp. NK2B42]